MAILFWLGCIIATTLAAATTTHKPHATREPNEIESMFFAYNYHTHSIVLKQRTSSFEFKCYISPLSEPERISVHTDDGMKAIELKLIASMYTAQKVDASTVHKTDKAFCGRATANHTLEYYHL